MLFTPIKPMLLGTAKEAFDNDNYIFEPKFDGFRILLHKQGDRVEVYTRHGNCLTGKFPELSRIVGSIHAESAILDCEGICLRDGRPNFDDFSSRSRLSNADKIKAAAKSNPATFVAFDVLYSHGTDHTRVPLIQRKKILDGIVTPSPAIIPTMFIEGTGKQLHQVTIDQKLEGIVCKRKDSLYHLDTRSDDWLKVKNFKGLDAVILGYKTDPHFALIIGAHFKTMRFKPIGTVEFGFKPEEKAAFLAIAQQIRTKRDKTAQWLEPRLCCRVDYLDRTDNHMLRTTVFRGFLFNRLAAECEWVS